MRTILFAVLAAVLSSPLAAAEVGRAPGEAQVTRIEFFAFGEEAPEAKTRVSFCRGVSFPDMGEINDYTDHINNTFSGQIESVERGDNYRLGLEHLLGNNWYAGLAYERLEAETSGPLVVMGVTRRLSIDLEVDGAEVFLKKRWPEALGPVDVHGLAGVGHYWSTYTEREDGFSLSGVGEQVGARAGLGLRWQISRTFSLSIEASYRWLKFGTYERGGLPIRFTSPGSPRVKADFSGINACACVGWHF